MSVETGAVETERFRPCGLRDNAWYDEAHGLVRNFQLFKAAWIFPASGVQMIVHK